MLQAWNHITAKYISWKMHCFLNVIIILLKNMQVLNEICFAMRFFMFFVYT